MISAGSVGFRATEIIKTATEIKKTATEINKTATEINKATHRYQYLF